MWFCAYAETRPLPETLRIPRRGVARGGDRKRLWFSATVEQLLSGGSECSVPEAFRRDAALGRVSVGEFCVVSDALGCLTVVG